ncbi:DUF899 family protein [Deinococcus yavapaiensis]|uniref:Putative dithiol-disulfide oxidoreductase (DUF899 family) n=1 Tax=Deinococcus yavapaiensis KR-236 TaxID=694435 RepID=A0A318S2Y0_9DEIO|nr:DUF899 family protein [Deinococcus yavapaiensis]PYE50447.1 putative dithiol-disulfide oxidoreductase (DUF899 family) [Deinococcus yavapaiensis KR-236]
MIDTTQARPPVVDLDTWRRARTELLTLEKVATRLTDSVAAQRRRLPMTPVPNYTFTGKDGSITLAELFEGRPQLIVHHFMFHPDWDAGCPSCTHFAENATPHRAHLKAMDANFVRVSRAPIGKLLAYARRKGWNTPWYSSYETNFNQDWGWTDPDGNEGPGLSVYLLLDGQPHLTYVTTGRGVEAMSSYFGYADLLPYGRQELWQQVPPGWPQF